MREELVWTWPNNQRDTKTTYSEEKSLQPAQTLKLVLLKEIDNSSTKSARLKLAYSRSVFLTAKYSKPFFIDPCVPTMLQRPFGGRPPDS